MGKLALFCGRSLVAWNFASRMLEKNPERIAFIEFEGGESAVVYNKALALGIPTFAHTSEDTSAKLIQAFDVSTVVLLWWPKIVHKINKLGISVINTHPSYLPYNRGKHPYYWSIVDGTPFGATIHRVDDGIDTGTILWRKEITLTPLDTGESAYNKGVSAMNELLREQYENIVHERFPSGVRQNEEKATYHHSRDLEAPMITEGDGKLFDFVNDCRARTFDNARSGRQILIDGNVYRIHLKLVEEEYEAN